MKIAIPQFSGSKVPMGAKSDLFFGFSGILEVYRGGSGDQTHLIAVFSDFSSFLDDFPGVIFSSFRDQ